MDTLLIILIVIPIVFISLIFHWRSNFKTKLRNLEKESEMKMNEYLNVKRQINIPNNAFRICLLSTLSLDDKIVVGENYVWKSNDKLNFFPSESRINIHYNIKAEGVEIDGLKYPNVDFSDSPFFKIPEKFELFSINIKDIRYFEGRGEKYYENKFSGGGGGGSSFGNAIAGGVVAGTAGAIVASRKKIEPIKSEFIEHDERRCDLIYFRENKKHILAFDYLNYDELNELIPEKNIRSNHY